MKINYQKKIGILGGSFDPAHKGHLAISKEALKKFNLRCIIWAITARNPFKKESTNNLKKRIIFCKKIIGKNSKEIKRILGYEGRDELIHKDDLVKINS